MNTYHIVVVDDDTTSLTYARNLLKDQGMRVSVIKSGAELLTFMKRNSPDIILLDIMMPIMDGFETYKALREMEENEHRDPVPIIFLTGSDDSEVEHKGLEMGAEDFIKKPLVGEALLSRIRNTIKRAKALKNLRDESTIDQLTGLYNKSSSGEKLSIWCQKEHGALIVLDLDNFKLVNDLYGHKTGDLVLKAAANVFRDASGPGDILCRIGGDEFCVFFKGISNDSAGKKMLRRMNTQLTSACKKIMGADMDIPIGVSAGAVYVPKYGRDYGELFKLADKSLYYVKQNGKHGFISYDPSCEDDDDETDLEKLMLRLSSMLDERNETENALLLGRESFTWIYRYVRRFRKRYGGIHIKVLFLIEPVDDNGTTDIATYVETFSELLQSTLRKSDIIMKYGENRYFLLMPEQKAKDAEIVLGRIMTEWQKIPENSQVKISYVVDQIEFEKPVWMTNS